MGDIRARTRSSDYSSTGHNNVEGSDINILRGTNMLSHVRRNTVGSTHDISSCAVQQRLST